LARADACDVTWCLSLDSDNW